MPDTKPKRSANHLIDMHVGARVRAVRLQRGLSQSALARQLGLSFQQLQKYETAANRISASTLYTISRALEVEPYYFFDGLNDASYSPEMMELDLEAVRIAGLISRITDSNIRASLKELIRRIAPEHPEEFTST